MTGHFRRPRPRPSLRLTLLLASLPLLLLVAARAQQPEPLHPQPPSSSEPKIAVTVKTVNVVAVVRDKHGKIVPDLPVESFVLTEDGRPQSINYFAHESDLPLRLGLLVDTSLSQRRVLEQERSASYAFVTNLLREKQDLAFVVNFDREVQLLQDFTDSRPKLQAAFEQLSVPQFQSRNSGYGRARGGNGGGNGGGGGSSDPNDPHPGPPRGGGTHLYDAVYLASDELMSKQQGRKALIILSDGVDHGSKETLADAVEAAQRADTVIYSILFKDEEGFGHGGHIGFGGPMGVPMGGPGGGGHGGPPRGGHPPDSDVDGKKVLAELSRKSGGRLFQVSKKETLEKIYAEIEEELRNQYRFGYTPDKGAEPGYHHISLTTHNKDLSVQTRDGYYGGP